MSNNHEQSPHSPLFDLLIGPSISTAESEHLIQFGLRPVTKYTLEFPNVLAKDLVYKSLDVTTIMLNK